MTVKGVAEHTDASVKSVAASGKAVCDRTLALLMPVLLGVAAVIIVGQWLVRRTIINPVKRVAGAAEQLAQGEFDVDLSTTANDECGDMLRGRRTSRYLA